MRVLWLTDIHLNFLISEDTCRLFGEYMREGHQFDEVLVTGDIAEAPSLVPLLKAFAAGIGEDRQVRFVLGNHDFYHGSIAKVHASLAEPLAPNLTWLDTAEPILLDDQTALVGKYAWYDAVFGDGVRSEVLMSDFKIVKEFRERFQEYRWIYDAREGGRNRLLRKLRALAHDAAQEAMPKLVGALERRNHVIFATHIPPFEGACWHEGKLSNPQWMPWFTSAAMGKMLEKVAAAYPQQKILVLCGHTHSPGVYQHAPNLRVVTGRAEYYAPDVAGIITPQSFENWDTVLT